MVPARTLLWRITRALLRMWSCSRTPPAPTLPLPAPNTILGYEVFDVNGRLVRSNSVNSTRITMERKGLTPGAYNVRLRFAEGYVTRKLMLD